MKVHHVKKARKAIPNQNIEVGDSYYWWKFRYGGKCVSKTQPKPSQLTQSSFLVQVYEIQEEIEQMTPESQEDLQVQKDEIVDKLQSLRDECDENLMNMPDHLQDSSNSGQLLQERIEGLDDVISEFENIELDIDEEEIRKEVIDELEEEKKNEEDELDEEEIQLKVDEKIQEKIDEIICEFASVSFPF